MGLLSRIGNAGRALAGKAIERRGYIEDMLALLSRGWMSKAGTEINNDTGIHVAVVLACCRVIAEGIAQMPVRIMKIEDNGSSQPQRKDPLWRLLANRPNEWQTSFEFREMLTIHAALTGNGYAWKNMDSNRQVMELIPLVPTRVRAVQDKDLVVEYKVRDANGKELTLPREEIFHLRGPSWDGVHGMEMVQLAREAIGLSIALEESQSRLHKNGVSPSGIYSIEGTLDTDARKRFRASIQEMNEGLENVGRVLILDRNGKFTPTAMTGVDAQHLESRKFQLEEICRSFRVFPQMIGFQDKPSTYASAEQFFLAHVIHTLQPWVERWEDCIERDLFGDRAIGNGFELAAKFTMSGLLRGDSAARSAFYTAGIASGWLTRNEVRAFEDLPHLDGLDEPLTPLNMQGKAGADAAAAGAPNSSGDVPSGGNTPGRANESAPKMMGHNGGPPLDEIQQRIGRVLSAENEGRVRDAHEKLNQVLATLEAEGTN